MRKLNTFLTNQFVMELNVSLHAVRKADQHIADQDNGNYNLNNSIKTTWLAIPSEPYEEMHGFTSFLRKRVITTRIVMALVLFVFQRFYYPIQGMTASVLNPAPPGAKNTDRHNHHKDQDLSANFQFFSF